MKTYIHFRSAQLRRLLRASWNANKLYRIPGTGLTVATDSRSEPIETRSGYDTSDTSSPFYCSESGALRAYYAGYGSSLHASNLMDYEDFLYFSGDGINAAGGPEIDFAKIKLSVKAYPYKIPISLIEHAEEAVRLFKEMRKINFDKEKRIWENNNSLRVISVDGGVISCQPATYFDQVGTNLTLDWASGKIAGARTIRSGVEHPQAGKLLPFEKSSLANTLGVAAVVYDRNLQPIVRLRRGEELASINKNGLHCTVSGVFEHRSSKAVGEHSGEVFLDAMAYEIERETSLLPDEYKLFPVAFARELARGGKPQLFFVAQSKLSTRDFHARAAEAIESREYLELTSEQEEVLAESTKTYSDRFTYEALAAFRLAELFVEANRDLFSRY